MKKILTAVIMTCALFLSITSANAAETSITYSGDQDKFQIADSSATNFDNMMPGEERTVKVNLTNNDQDNLNFYMSSDIIDNIAEKGDKDAVYDFSIAKDGKSFFSTVIGGTDSNTVGKEYLTDDNRILLANLDKGEATTVSITLKLDGDSTGNAYMNQSGEIKFVFTVGTHVTTTTTTSGPVQNIYNTIYKYVKTGDATPILTFVGLMVVALIGIVVFGKKKKKEEK